VGLGIYKPSNCQCGSSGVFKIIEKIIEKVMPNPDPNKFSILKIEEHEDLVIVLICYPDCVNYEGKKILVFENTTEKQIRELKFIDPHFCPSSHVSPIARFEPTDRGWQMARSFIGSWTHR
jgi:hypothetical protein